MAGPGTATGAARWALDRAIDKVRARFGRDALGYAAVVFREGGGVPDEFRELAEAKHDVAGEDGNDGDGCHMESGAVPDVSRLHQGPSWTGTSGLPAEGPR